MKLSEVPSSDVDELLMQVFVLQKMGYPEIALQKCLNSINCGEDNEEVVILAAELYVEANSLQEAYDLLSSSGLRYPDSLNIDVVLGEVCMQLGHNGEAIKRLSRVIDEMPGNKQAVLNLTRILIDIGEFQSACNTLDKWIAANDRDQWAYIISASMLDFFGRLDLAASFLSRAEKMFPESLHLPYLMTAVSDEKIPERAPLSHLRELFDETANGYDTHLKAIGNAGPRQIAEVIEHLDLREPKTYSILDAGCGTGLCGGLLKPHARWLEGIDLSPNMLEQAKSRVVTIT